MQSRLAIAGGVSLVANFVVWFAVGAAAEIHPAPPPTVIELQQIVVRRDGKRIVKVIKPEEVRKKVEKIVKEHHLVPPKTKPEPRRPEPIKPAPQKPPTKVAPRRTAPDPPHHAAPPPPQGAHNKVLTAKGDSPKKPESTALAGGSAVPGRPTQTQAPGEATSNPEHPPTKATPPSNETKPDSKSNVGTADPGPKTETKPAPPPPPPPPEEPPKKTPPPPEKPKKKGPSRDAQHSNEVNPSIPDNLKDQEFKKFVRVRVNIAADGSFEVVLRTSSGNDEVDRRVLDALKRWTWKAKLVDGEPVDSTQLFRFDFEVK